MPNTVSLTLSLPKKKRKDPQTINHPRKEEKGGRTRKESKKNQNELKEATQKLSDNDNDNDHLTMIRIKLSRFKLMCVYILYIYWLIKSIE